MHHISHVLSSTLNYKNEKVHTILHFMMNDSLINILIYPDACSLPSSMVGSRESHLHETWYYPFRSLALVLGWLEGLGLEDRVIVHLRKDACWHDISYIWLRSIFWGGSRSESCIDIYTWYISGDNKPHHHFWHMAYYYKPNDHHISVNDFIMEITRKANISAYK